MNRSSDDETLEQIWYRLRLLLDRHYNAFHERAADPLSRYKRFALIAGPRALDGVRYAEKPFDRDALIAGYRTTYRSRPLAHAVGRLARAGDSRALTLAVEIIHRGVARGFDTYDVMSPLADVIAANDPEIMV